MGCLPSFLVVISIIAFILYAIGGFNNGIGGVGQSLRSFWACRPIRSGKCRKTAR